ncbi:Uncharacterized protein OS=Caldilinea aerophila (strain DSM 14535 / JCM 11387 / NBRC 104270 / STL-6-O1) GN=CLDAP_17510 PE=4 SV=1: CotH [Gemmata massiliana]|uniref:CotH protein n=1 Tax=Gemmata massiliana TaxID=1210884 RepID=A0A6P2DHI1_9BACT|nr:CotH kinase family protein [Gemmata massiliana]VTS01167.1 Uncharacterized protein OS=Caldilinea aerophila (strain DSM 14535 / JCM 11387 / NBRC 104270 / STL-6-O1) GN=CLDAP_17510 PE=4 SV=1: CotH [Gemmata massiliana]
MIACCWRRLMLSWLILVGAAVGASAAEPEKAAAISHVQHEPVAPKPGASVLVTVRLAEGVTKPVLKLQLVAPGKYIRKGDAEYEKNWFDLTMRDDGKEGDAKAGDGVYSARVPATYQKHRWLVRYRVAAVGRDGKAIQAPEADDTCPNFAWWCDAGPAMWSGSREPGKAPVVKFPAAFLGTLQTIHLLARAEDVAKSQWDGNFHKQKQQGTLVYRGVVYDHIQYSNRGQGSAHIAGKNKWGLKFNRGHEVPFADHDDKPFPAACRGLDLNPGQSTPYLPVHRGIAGMDEVLSMRSYRLAGVPSPPATWVQWRVVTGATEVPKDQFAGDLWGLYVALGDMEPKLLADRKLPDGLTVSAQSGIKHTPKTITGDQAQKEWETFLNGMRSNPKEEWWRKNLDLPAYYSFHALNRLLGNVDLRPDGNHGYYRHPDGRWAPIPWDMDMTFVPRHHQPGHIEAIGCLNHPAIAIEYRNRAREILDLFAADGTDRGGQVGQLVADLSAALTPKKHDVDWPRLDEARWNFSPRINPKGAYFVNPSSADHFGGKWTRTLATNDFAGFRKYLVDFCTDSRPTKNYAPNDGDQRGYGWGYLAHEAKDDKIPAKPTVERPDGKFRFEAAAFVSPAGRKSVALEWRVGRVGQLGWYELDDHWRKEEGSGRTIDIPADVFKAPGEYRVRARWRDDTGRCGHWSAPVEVRVK